MTDFKSLLIKLQQNLNILQEREAKYGGNAPLELVNQISDHREAIALTEQALRNELSEDDWRQALQPLLVAIQARTGDEVASSVTLGDIGGGIHQSTIAGRDVNQITLNVVTLLGQAVSAEGQALSPSVQTILEVALAQVKTVDPRTAHKYPENPTGYEAPLSDALADLLQADRGLAARLDMLLTRYEQATKERPTSTGTSYRASLKGSGAIAQGPGAQAVGARGVLVGGNVGRSVVTGNENIISSEVVGRDQIQGLSGEDLAQLFHDIYRRIEARPADPNVGKEEVTETVQKIEQEATKGEAANPSKVERWLKTLYDMAPDIAEVTIACLTNPAAGVATVIRKIGEKAKMEQGKGNE